MKSTCINCGNELEIDYFFKTKMGIKLIFQININVQCKRCGMVVPIAIIPQRTTKVVKEHAKEVQKEADYIG